MSLAALGTSPAVRDIERQLEQFIGTLWDIGLEVGHSGRNFTIEGVVMRALRSFSSYAYNGNTYSAAVIPRLC